MRYYGKRGELRIQSGQVSASSLHYLTVGFVNMDFTGPSGRTRPDEIPVTDRGRLNSNAHYIQGSDEAIMAPIEISFTADLDDTVNRQDLHDALSNPDRKAPWTVGGLSFTNTNGTSKLLNGSYALISCPPPADTNIDRVDVAVLWRGGTPGTNDEGRAYRETWFHPGNIRITESDVAVRLAVTGLCFGAISSITAFSAGSAV